MAQIIKHRRGSLESVSTATKRSGELLVVTGSAGITATNSNGLLFVGIDGSTVTATNKILHGTSVPDLTGASYDTSVDGIPFYDTSANKLYILNKGGNVEVQATANTNGTGIVSSSAQIDTLGFLQVDGDSVISGSSQVQIDSVTGFTSFSESLDGRLDSLESFSSSLEGGFVNNAELAAATGALETADTAIEGRLDNIESFTESIDTTIKTKLDAEAVVSSSAQISAFNTFLEIDGDGVVSSSAQIVSLLSNQATDFGTGRVSADDFGNADGSSTITGSFVGDGSGLTGLATNLIISGTTGNDSVDLLNDALTFAGTANEIEIAVTNNQVQVGIVENPTLTGTVTITGDLQVQGTTTTVDSTTINLGDNIIQLNGTGAAYGGLIIVDTTAPNQVSGSLLWDATNDYWIAGASGSESKVLLADGDGVVSGSAQVTSLLPTGVVSGSSQVDADSITNFDTNVKAKLDADTVISGSSQVLIDSVDGFSTFSSSVDSRVVALETTFSSSVDTRLDSLESFSSSLEGGFVNNAELAAATGALETADTAQQARLSSIESFTQSIDTTIKTKLDADAVVSSSAQIVTLLSDQATDFGTGRVSADDFGNADGTSTFTGSFVGDGSGITGLSTTITISGSDGSNDTVSLLDGALSFVGGTGVSATVATDTVTISVQDASTSVKGIASFDADDFNVASGNVSIKSAGVRAANLNADVAGTGISLNGVDNSIEVDYGSSAGTAVEGNTSLTVQGTNNEIEVTSGNVTLGAGGTVTIGLPDSVTIATASIQNDLSVGGNVEITGNLSVLGTTTTINSTTVELGDNIIELNGAGNANAGLLVKDVTAPNTVSGSLLWDSTNDFWKGGALGSEKEFARINSSISSGSILKADANGLLVDSVLSDDGTDATFSGDVIVDGFGSNANGAFLFADANNTLTAVAPTNAGDVIQWNGSSFVASNELDGGTF